MQRTSNTCELDNQYSSYNFEKKWRWWVFIVSHCCLQGNRLENGDSKWDGVIPRWSQHRAVIERIPLSFSSSSTSLLLLLPMRVVVMTSYDVPFGGSFLCSGFWYWVLFVVSVEKGTDNHNVRTWTLLDMLTKSRKHNAISCCICIYLSGLIRDELYFQNFPVPGQEPITHDIHSQFNRSNSIVLPMFEVTHTYFVGWTML